MVTLNEWRGRVSTEVRPGCYRQLLFEVSERAPGGLAYLDSSFRQEMMRMCGLDSHDLKEFLVRAQKEGRVRLWKCSKAPADDIVVQLTP